MHSVYGVGNPLIDILVEVSDEFLNRHGIHKGAMHLIGVDERQRLLESLSAFPPTYSCGGSCPNTIITLAALGVPATLAGKVGDDEYGAIYRKQVAEHHVKDRITVSSSHPTGSSVILITQDSERTMNTYLGANRFYGREDVDLASVLSSDVFHFTGYMYDTDNQKEAIHYALNEAKNTGMTISFDIADIFAVGRNREAFLSLISEYCDIAFANADEARILFNHYDPYECCRSLGQICRTAVVKNGKLGSLISHNGVIYRIPVEGPSTPVDTTGAGDIYAAGFLYGMCRDFSIEDSGYIASYLAGEIIQNRGAQFSPEKMLLIREHLARRFPLD